MSDASTTFLTRKGTEQRLQLVRGCGRAILHSDPGPLTVSAICRHAGVTRPSFYYYFDSVEAVVDALAEEVAGGVADDVALLHKNHRGLSRLISCLSSIMDRLEAEPDWGRLAVRLSEATSHIQDVFLAEGLRDIEAAAVNGQLALDDKDSREGLAQILFSITYATLGGAVPVDISRRTLSLTLQLCGAAQAALSELGS